MIMLFLLFGFFLFIVGTDNVSYEPLRLFGIRLESCNEVAEH